MQGHGESTAGPASRHLYPARHAQKPHIHFPHIRFHRRELTDRPLAGKPHPDHPLHWKLYGCEAVATGVLMMLGIMTNTFLAAPGSFLAVLLRAHPALQTALCGLCFGSAGTLAAMTRFGRTSGAHLSPSVTLAFTLGGKLAPLDAGGYFAAQIVGACVGTALIYLSGRLLPGWGAWLCAVHYASTLPAHGLALYLVMLAELAATMGLVFALYYAASHPRLHLFAPWVGGAYFFCANPFVAWISGDSTNFARSLGPALFNHDFFGLWIYLVGPLLGSALAVLVIRSRLFGQIHLAEARIINFGHYGRVPRFSEPAAVGPSPAQLEKAEHGPESNPPAHQ
ncbi:MIP/aquaporin family protein [Acidocella sp.]|uniref:MIP/aquaporin family protein n=1 Tax=Acidocella sp. TaxID=50710 RepID=UPI003D07E3DA